MSSYKSKKTSTKSKSKSKSKTSTKSKSKSNNNSQSKTNTKSKSQSNNNQNIKLDNAIIFLDFMNNLEKDYEELKNDFDHEKLKKFIKKYLSLKPSFYYFSAEKHIPLLLNEKIINKKKIKDLDSLFYAFGQTGDLVPYKYVKLRKCKYGYKCFRKSKEHKLDFYHSGDKYEYWSNYVCELLRTFF